MKFLNNLLFTKGSSQGFSTLEMIVALGISAILVGTAIPNFSSMVNRTDDALNSTLGFLKQVRAKAIATTSAYRVTSPNNSQFITEYLTNCSSTTSTIDSQLTLDLPSGIIATAVGPAPDISICFDSRGFVQSPVNIYLTDNDTHYGTIEVFLGGAVRIQP